MPTSDENSQFVVIPADLYRRLNDHVKKFANAGAWFNCPLTYQMVEDLSEQSMTLNEHLEQRRNARNPEKSGNLTNEDFEQA